MSALQTIKSLLTFQPGPGTSMPVKSVPENVEVFGPLGQRNADWSGVNENPALSRSYRLCATAYACATYLADAVSEAPLRVYRRIDGDLQEQPDHRLRTLLANPNEYQSESEMMSLTVMTMAMFGYGVIEKVRSGAGLPVQLWPLRPDWLVREKRNDGGTQFVYRRPQREPRVIRDENLILIPYRHDERQQQIGVSPLQIVAREIGIDVALTDLLKVFLDAGGIPPWAVEFSGDIQPEQHEVDAFREQWGQKYGGWSAYANIGVLMGGMKLVKVGDSIGDMAWPDLRGLVEMKIAQAFRVPAELIQARDSMSSGGLTTTEVEGAMAQLQAFGATPLRARIDGAFTRGLLPDFTGGDAQYTIEFDTSEIMSLQEDRNALHERIRADWDAGAITLNQYLTETGRPELGAPGEVYKVSFTTTYVPVRELLGVNEPAPPKSTIREIGARSERQYVDRKAFTDADLKARNNYLGQMNRNRQKLEQIGTRHLRKFFKDQGERMVDALPKSDAPIDVKVAPVNWDEEDDLLHELMNRYYQEIGKSAFHQIHLTTGAELAWDVANPKVQDVMTELALRVVGISDTTRTDVQRIVTDGMAEGLNNREIADNLKGLFEETYRNRSATIARTETMIGYNKASTLGYQESGEVSEVELVDNPDHPEDYGASDGLTCAERDGLRVPVADVDKHIEAEHPNGSLAVIPILDRALGE